jgi:hypothetical protein
VRRPEVRLRLSGLAAAVLIGAGCGDGTGPGGNQIQYQLALTAFGSDTTVERVRGYECFLYGFFTLPLPVSADSLVTFPITVQRRLLETRGTHSEVTSADTAIAEATLDYTGLGEDSLQFLLTAGPYTVTLGPGGFAPGNPTEYSGEWSCSPDVPLGQDSTLLAYGHDPDLSIPGTWRLSELLPIE